MAGKSTFYAAKTDRHQGASSVDVAIKKRQLNEF